MRIYGTFRSTIQRRRIETWLVCHRFIVHVQLSEVQSREEGLKLIARCCSIAYQREAFRSTIQRRRIETVYVPSRVIAKRGFQKYNPEKKD